MRSLPWGRRRHAKGPVQAWVLWRWQGLLRPQVQRWLIGQALLVLLLVLLVLLLVLL